MKQIWGFTVSAGIVGTVAYCEFSAGAAIAAAIIWFLILMLGKLFVDNEKKVQRAVADEQKRIFDADIAQGVNLIYNGKPWRQGCRIDPETGAMIEPGV